MECAGSISHRFSRKTYLSQSQECPKYYYLSSPIKCLHYKDEIPTYKNGTRVPHKSLSNQCYQHRLNNCKSVLRSATYGGHHQDPPTCNEGRASVHDSCCDIQCCNLLVLYCLKTRTLAKTPLDSPIDCRSHRAMALVTTTGLGQTFELISNAMFGV